MDTSRANVRIVSENVVWTDVRSVFAEQLSVFDGVSLLSDEGFILETTTVSVEYSVSKTLPFPSSPNACWPYYEPYVYVVLFKCADGSEYKDRGMKKRLQEIAQALRAANRPHVFAFVYDSTPQSTGNGIVDKLKDAERDQKRVLEKVRSDLPQKTRLCRLDELHQLGQLLRQCLTEAFSERIAQHSHATNRLLTARNSAAWDIYQYVLTIDSQALVYCVFRLFQRSLSLYDDLFQFVTNNETVFGDAQSLTLESFSGRVFDVLQKPYRDMIESKAISAFDLHEYVVSRQVGILTLANMVLEAGLRAKQFVRYYMGTWDKCARDEMRIRGAVWAFCSCVSIAEMMRLWADGRSLVQSNSIYELRSDVLLEARFHLISLAFARGLLHPEGDGSSFTRTVLDRFVADHSGFPHMPVEDLMLLRNRDLAKGLNHASAFEAFLIDLTDNVANSYEKKGRRRWLADLWIDVAMVHIVRGQYTQAYDVFRTQLSVLDVEKWSMLRSRHLPAMALCQERTNRLDELLVTYLELSSDPATDADQRLRYFESYQHTLNHFGMAGTEAENENVPPRPTVCLNRMVSVTATIVRKPVLKALVMLESNLPQQVSFGACTLCTRRTPFGRGASSTIRSVMKSPGGTEYSATSDVGQGIVENIEFYHGGLCLTPGVAVELSFCLESCPSGYYVLDSLFLEMPSIALSFRVQLADTFTPYAADFVIAHPRSTLQIHVNHADVLIPRWKQDVSVGVECVGEAIVKGVLKVYSTSGMQLIGATDIDDTADLLRLPSSSTIDLDQSVLHESLDVHCDDGARTPQASEYGSFAQGSGFPGTPALKYPSLELSFGQMGQGAIVKFPVTVYSSSSTRQTHHVKVTLQYDKEGGERFYMVFDHDMVFRPPLRAVGRVLGSARSRAFSLTIDISNDSDRLLVIDSASVRFDVVSSEVLSFDTPLLDSVSLGPGEQFTLVFVIPRDDLMTLAQSSISKAHVVLGCRDENRVSNVLEVGLDADAIQGDMLWRAQSFGSIHTKALVPLVDGTDMCVPMEVRLSFLPWFVSERVQHFPAGGLSVSLEIVSRENNWLVLGKHAERLHFSSVQQLEQGYVGTILLVPLGAGRLALPGVSAVYTTEDGRLLRCSVFHESVVDVLPRPTLLLDLLPEDHARAMREESVSPY